LPDVPTDDLFDSTGKPIETTNNKNKKLEQMLEKFNRLPKKAKKNNIEVEVFWRLYL